MKVALVTEWLDAWRGGAETSTLQFLHHLMDHGIEIHLITRSRPSPTPGLHVHTIRGASMSRTRRSMTFAHHVERILQSDAFDVVHAISLCRGADIYQPRGGTVAETIERNLALRRTALGRALKRCGNLFNFKRRHQLRMERELLGDPAGPLVVAISDYVVDQLKRHHALPDERIRKIFNAVDPDTTPESDRADHRQAIRREFGIRPDDYLVLLIAHNFRLKGVQRWMEALSLLHRQGATDVRSLVIGKGDGRRWHRLADRLRIADRLTFTGPTDRVHEFHHAADILVHPTYYDPCSRVVLEALGAGLACITTRWDGASEVIQEGRSGFVLEDPADVATLAKRVNELRSKELRSRMGLAARTTGAHTGMSRHAEEVLALYREVAAKTRAGLFA